MTSIKENCIEVFGERGKLILDRNQKKVRLCLPQEGHSFRHRLLRGIGVLSEATHDFSSAVRRSSEPSYRLALQTFVDAIQEKSVVQSSTLKDGCRCLMVVHAAEQSARTQSVVRLQADTFADSVSSVDLLRNIDDLS